MARAGGVEVGVDGREAAPFVHPFDQQAYRVIVPMRVRALDRRWSSGWYRTREIRVHPTKRGRADAGVHRMHDAFHIREAMCEISHTNFKV
jgi:hypothetical protein